MLNTVCSCLTFIDAHITDLIADLNIASTVIQAGMATLSRALVFKNACCISSVCPVACARTWAQAPLLVVDCWPLHVIKCCNIC